MLSRGHLPVELRPDAGVSGQGAGMNERIHPARREAALLRVQSSVGVAFDEGLAQNVQRFRAQAVRE